MAVDDLAIEGLYFKPSRRQLIHKDILNCRPVSDYVPVEENRRRRLAVKCRYRSPVGLEGRVEGLDEIRGACSAI